MSKVEVTVSVAKQDTVTDSRTISSIITQYLLMSLSDLMLNKNQKVMYLGTGHIGVKVSVNGHLIIKNSRPILRKPHLKLLASNVYEVRR